MSAAVPRFTPWALLAESSTGSTWVNHVLSSHPCVVSVGELLMTNATAARMWHKLDGGVDAVLQDVAARNRAQLAARVAAAECPRSAGGIKLKLVERDVTFGEGGNALKVVAALARLKYHVILLQRTNHLDSILGRLSRKQTGVTHCHSSHGPVTKPKVGRRLSKCDATNLNVSFVLPCDRARDAIDRLMLRRQASNLIFRRWPSPPDGTGRMLRIEYETLVGAPAGWLATLRLLRLQAPAVAACSLRGEHEKRVLQTQREMLSNYDQLARCLRAAGPVYEHQLSARRPVSGTLPREDRSLCNLAPDSR